MSQDERLEVKINRLFRTIQDLPAKFSEAVQEALQEFEDLRCVKDGLLDFDRIEEDVISIQQDLKDRGDRVLGSHVILDDRKDTLVIKTYVERGNKTFSIIQSANVKRVTNIPEDVLNELKEKGQVKIRIDI